jgi:hypothetical protein
MRDITADCMNSDHVPPKLAQYFSQKSLLPSVLYVRETLSKLAFERFLKGKFYTPTTTESEPVLDSSTAAR